ncbi:MAG: glycine cleavage T C-terminal barrel domain-containing protein [Acidobacteriota bacterium]
MSHEGFTPPLVFEPRIRKSPYFEATRRYGAKRYTIYNHMSMATCFTDAVDEYWRLVKDVTLWDVACERQVEVRGPDAARFVQRLTPRNLSKCKPGQCRYVVLTAQDGGIINDAVLSRVGENHFWLSPGDGDVHLWAQGVAVNSGMDITVTEPDVSPLQLQGPKSPLVARALFGDWAAELKYYHLKEATLNGIPVVLARTGWSGEIGFEIFLRDASRGNELWEAVMDAGRPHNIAPIGPSEIRSIEGGILSYGCDMTRADNPFVIGLDRLVDLDQEADFIGKEALRRIKAEGVKRRLVGVEIHCEPISLSLEDPWPVSQDGRVIGRMTRCAHSPRLEKNIGFANVPVEVSDIGTRLVVETPVGRAAATVVAWPFFLRSRNTVP